MLLRGGLDCSLNSAGEAWKVAGERAAVCWKVLTARLAAFRTNQGKFVANCLLARSLVWGLARWWGVFEREGNRANRPDPSDLTDAPWAALQLLFARHHQLDRLWLRQGAGWGEGHEHPYPRSHASDLNSGLEGLGSDGSRLGGRKVIAAEVEEIVDLVMGEEETLSLPG
jgi:hypothetical protein